MLHWNIELKVLIVASSSRLIENSQMMPVCALLRKFWNGPQKGFIKVESRLHCCILLFVIGESYMAWLLADNAQSITCLLFCDSLPIRSTPHKCRERHSFSLGQRRIRLRLPSWLLFCDSLPIRSTHHKCREHHSFPLGNAELDSDFRHWGSLTFSK